MGYLLWKGQNPGSFRKRGVPCSSFQTSDLIMVIMVRCELRVIPFREGLTHELYVASRQSNDDLESQVKGVDRAE